MEESWVLALNGDEETFKRYVADLLALSRWIRIQEQTWFYACGWGHPSNSQTTHTSRIAVIHTLLLQCTLLNTGPAPKGRAYDLLHTVHTEILWVRLSDHDHTTRRQVPLLAATQSRLPIGPWIIMAIWMKVVWHFISLKSCYGAGGDVREVSGVG